MNHKTPHCIYLFFLIQSLFSVNTFAQNHTIVKCGEELQNALLEKKYPGYTEARLKNFELIRQESDVQMARNEKIRIPVVFHVIYNDDKQNIPDSLIFDQLDILNQSYQHIHEDTNDIREAFKALVGHADIEFFLAPQDPEGFPSTGITRTFTEITEFADPLFLITQDISSIERIKYSDQGGFNGWPANRYCNIWIADMSFSILGFKIPAILGLATPPAIPSLPENWPEGAIDGLKDGIILQYQTIGKSNPYAADLENLASQGKTAVHEMGHYLGLRHIWGDETNCDGSDGIEDTPPMLSSSQELPCPPANTNNCNEGEPDDLPDHWENYMDYSNDICQRMFTQGQVEHMRKVIAIQRDTLVSPLSTNKSTGTPLRIYPNPAQDVLNIEGKFEGTGLFISDFMGRSVLVMDNFNHSEQINISGFSPGCYFIVLTENEKRYVGSFVKPQ